MVERPCTITCQDKEHWCSGHWYQVQREEKNELKNLAQGEGRIDGRYGGFAQLLYGVFTIWIEDARTGHEIPEPFVDEHRIKDIHQGFVDKKSFKEQGHNSGPFPENQEYSIHPCERPVENGQKGDLGEVCP